MTPQELKDSIIQLALLGKIVEHVPEDGTGDEALKAAIKAVHSVRASFSDSDYTIDLPESWTWAKLSEITSDESLNDGNWVLSKDMAINGPVKLIQLGSIGNCKYKDKGFKYLTEEHFHELNGRQIYSGYLLVNRLIGDRMLACILPPIDGILMTAVDVCWIAPNDEIYDLQYLMYALTSNDFQSKVKALGRGTTRFRISKLNLINIAFPFPPLAEQKRIVAKIEELLPLIERYEKAWSRLEDFNKRFPGDMQKSILQMAIQGKLVEQRPEEGTGEELYKQIQAEKQALIKAGKIKKEKPLPEIKEDEITIEIPESWKWVRLSSVVDLLSGFAFKSEDFKTTGKFRLLRGINLGVNEIRWKETVFVDSIPDRVSDYLLCKGDVLLGLDRPWISDGTRVAVFDDAEDTYLVQRVLRIRSTSYLISSFVSYILHSSLLKSPLGGETTGISVPHISPNQVGSIVIPLPPLFEQKRIVARLEELLPLCEKLK